MTEPIKEGKLVGNVAKKVLIEAYATYTVVTDDEGNYTIDLTKPDKIDIRVAVG